MKPYFPPAVCPHHRATKFSHSTINRRRAAPPLVHRSMPMLSGHQSEMGVAAAQAVVNVGLLMRD
jgi:hypothetical protein